jgi:glycosyltransferase involved in cell wall biosynthesis
MRILFVTQNLPYPINSGSHLRTAKLIDLLMRDYEVFCFFMPSRRMSTEEFKKACPPNLNYHILLPLIKNRLGRGYEYFSSPILGRREVMTGLQHLVEMFDPDVAWLDYLFIGQYIPWFARKDIPVIYGTHNAQSKLTRQHARTEKSKGRRFVLSIMTILQSFHEKFFFRKARYVVCVSENDLEFHAAFVSRQSLAVVPNFVDINGYDRVIPYKGEHPYICFVGSIDNFQNAEGIKYFLRHVWDTVKRSANVKLLIVGHGANQDREILKLKHSDGDIVLLEDVDSVAPFLKGSLVSIVPLLHGSGTRLKIIESMACKTPVVSTSIGAEGIEAIHGKDIIIANSSNEFAQGIIQLINNDHLRRLISENAYEYAMRKFGFDTVRLSVQKILSEVCV